MPDKSIIPREIKTFNDYLTLTNAHIITGTPAKYIQYNWTANDLKAWQGFLSDWQPLYMKYLNRKGTYTTSTRYDLIAIIKSAIFYDFQHKLILKVKATVGLDANDCNTFRIPLKYASQADALLLGAEDSEPNKTIVTAETVYPVIVSHPGGYVRIKAYPLKTGSGKAKKLKGYDLVEYAIGVFYAGITALPTHADDIKLAVLHSSKADFMVKTENFTANLGELPQGFTDLPKVAIFFFRWAKSKHPDLNGPWSRPFKVNLL
jgi:hypothetical protein